MNSLLMECQANHSRTYSLTVRVNAENFLTRVYRYKILGNRYSVSVLEPCGYEPTQKVMKITALYCNAAALPSQWGAGFYLSHKFPNSVSYLREAEHLKANLMTISCLGTLMHPKPLYGFILNKRPTEQLLISGLLLPLNVMNREELNFHCF